jgi:hypothetical protein
MAKDSGRLPASGMRPQRSGRGLCRPSGNVAQVCCHALPSIEDAVEIALEIALDFDLEEQDAFIEEMIRRGL